MSFVKKIDNKSVPAIENNVALFDILPTNVAFNKTHVREYNPLQVLSRDGPFNFRIFSDSQFIDFSRIWFYLETKIEKKVGEAWADLEPNPSNVTDDDNISVVQNFGSSFIRQLKISINGVEQFNSQTLYPYRDYIAKEYGLGMSVRKGLYEAGCYYPDEPEKGQTNYTNEGFKKRAKYFTKGGKLCTYSLLNFDLANQNNLFINNTDVHFSIYPNKDSFLLLRSNYKKTIKKAPKAGDPLVDTIETMHNNTTYRITILSAKIYCTFVDVVQSLQNQIVKQLEVNPAKYSLRRMEFRSQFISPSQTNLTWNVFGSVIPRRVMVFMVNNKAFDGNVSLSPFHFEHGNLQTISVEANNLIVPDNPYHFNFQSEDANFVRSFVDFYEGLDLINQERGIELTMDKYRNGWTGWVFPLASSHRDVGDSFELIKNGTTVIKAHFAYPVPEPGYMMVAVGEFDEVLTINADRIMSVDGSI